VAATCRQAKRFGIEVTAPSVDIKKVMQHVQGVINQIKVHDSVERFEGLGVTVIQKAASFVDTKTVKAEEYLVKARDTVIATGSSANVPPISGLESVNYFTNENIFSLTENPKHLLVIGGGPIGIELAQAFLLLGIKVTLLEVNKILPRDDEELVGILKNELLQQGLNLFEGVQINQVGMKGKQVKIQFEHAGVQQEVTGSHLLVATGRKPNVEHLNLDAAGIAYTPRGITVDERLRTSQKRIYAIGDVVGPYQFTHMAGYHAGVVIRNIVFKLPARVRYNAVPWVTYTDPELAHVGLLLSEAQKADPLAKVVSFDFADNDRAQAEKTSVGKINVILSKKAEVLGVSILGPHAGELLLPWMELVAKQKSLEKFNEIIVPYPTLSEVAKQVTGEYYKPVLFSKKVKALVRFLGWF